MPSLSRGPRTDMRSMHDVAEGNSTHSSGLAEILFAISVWKERGCASKTMQTNLVRNHLEITSAVHGRKQ